MADLTGFQGNRLSVLAGPAEPNGLAVTWELETSYAAESHQGRVYPNLDTLVEKGVLSKGIRAGRTNWSKVTSRGRPVVESSPMCTDRTSRGD